MTNVGYVNFVMSQISIGLHKEAHFTRKMTSAYSNFRLETNPSGVTHSQFNQFAPNNERTPTKITAANCIIVGEQVIAGASRNQIW